MINIYIVVGIAAGGTTPYVLGALQWCCNLPISQRPTTALICCVHPSSLPPSIPPSASSATSCSKSPKSISISSLPPISHLICLPVGAEIVTGSTRLKV